MRILFTTAWYPNRKVAGDGVFIQKHARAVARLNDVAVLMVQTDEAIRGWRVDICPEQETATSVQESRLRELLIYVPKTRFEIPVVTGLIRLAWLMIGYIKGYRYIKKNWWQGERPEACHVNVLTRAAGLPWLLSKIHHIPYIITEHWSRYARPEAYPNSSLQLRLGRLFVKDAAYICPVSLNLEKAMKKWELNNKHYTRISNVVDTDLFVLPSNADAPESNLKESHIPRFVHVSWMRDDSKNISGILRVLARLQADGLTYRMDFIGEGNDKEMLMDYAHQLGLSEPEVSFLPAQQGPALVSALQQHDALLMFSHFENQPVSVLEALACGLPVIATHVGTIPSMLAQKRGITVEPRNEDQLYDALKNFIILYQTMSPEQRLDKTLPQARHQYVAEHHSPQVIGRQFDALYHAASSRSKAR